MVQDRGLPTSDELADRLLEAAHTAHVLGVNYYAAWGETRTARINRDLTRAEVVSSAYANGSIDGKNVEQRASQLDDIVLHNPRLTAYEDSLRIAEARLKDAETLLEAARVYRSALDNLVALRIAELGAIAKTEAQLATAISAMDAILTLAERSTGRRFIERGTDWRTLNKD